MPPLPPSPLPSSPGGPAATLRRVLKLPADAPVLLPLAGIGGACALLCAGYAYAAGWLTPARLTPARVVGAFETNFGVHPGLRRNHTKGICVTGRFDGNGQAAPYSTASVFGTTGTPVVGRFAVPGGNPSVPDTAIPVRSMALLFQLPDGQQWRTGMNSTPVVVSNTPQGFYENVVASRPDPATGKPDPARMKAYFAAHPESRAFTEWVKAHPPSSSFANTRFYGINAFYFVDTGGAQHLVRWSMVPELDYAPLAPGKAAPDVLQDDLAARLRQGPVRWHLLVQFAEPGDPSADATRAWPDARRTVDAGVLTLQQESSQADGPCRDINFDPTVLPQGIRISDDPLLAARAGAYARAYNQRTREQAAMPAAQGGTR